MTVLNTSHICRIYSHEYNIYIYIYVYIILCNHDKRGPSFQQPVPCWRYAALDAELVWHIFLFISMHPSILWGLQNGFKQFNFKSLPQSEAWHHLVTLRVSTNAFWERFLLSDAINVTIVATTSLQNHIHDLKLPIFWGSWMLVFGAMNLYKHKTPIIHFEPKTYPTQIHQKGFQEALWKNMPWMGIY